MHMFRRAEKISKSFVWIKWNDSLFAMWPLINIWANRRFCPPEKKNITINISVLFFSFYCCVCACFFSLSCSAPTFAMFNIFDCSRIAQRLVITWFFLSLLLCVCICLICPIWASKTGRSINRCINQKRKLELLEISEITEGIQSFGNDMILYIINKSHD